MKILFDQGTPVPLKAFLPEHMVLTAYEKNWGELQNGELIQAAENDGFDLLVTTDKNLKYQQNLDKRKIGIVVLLSANWPKIKTNISNVVEVISKARRSVYIEVPIG